MSTTILSLTSIGAAIIMVAIAMLVVLNTSRSARKARTELKTIKELLIQVSNGSFDGDNAPPQIKESADILTALKRIAKDVKQQQQAVTHFAYIDELTGLANKRRFDEELVRSYNFAKRGLPVCIVSIEVSDLKKINSESGRATGDKILKMLAKTMENKIRKTDLTARLGSDEFALVLPNMESNKIQEWLTTLSEQFIEQQRNENLLPDNLSCNARFGYSFINKETDNEPQQVLDRATHALSKINGGGSTIAMEG